MKQSQNPARTSQRPVPQKIRDSVTCTRARRTAGWAAAATLIVAIGACGATAGEDAPAPSDDLALVRADEAERVRVFEHAARAVVCIFPDLERLGVAGGSGVVIDPDGYGLTNFHVVAEFVATRRGLGGLSDGRLYPLEILGIDPGGDVAFFKLSGRERFEFAPLGDSDALAVGQAVAAMGNPFLLSEDYAPTITLGIISGLHRYQVGQGNLLEYADCIQVSTSINPGNSGGPLFDLAGRVIGVNGRASFEERGRVNVGLGYAISINQIRRFLPGLRSGRLLEHGTLGATVRASGDDLIFDAIQDFSPAEQAGVELGDALLSLAGRTVLTANDYNNILATLPAGWPVALRVRRDGREVGLAARLERLPARAGLLHLPDPEAQERETRRVLDRCFAQATRRATTPAPRELWFEARVAIGDAPPEPLTIVRFERGAGRASGGADSIDFADDPGAPHPPLAAETPATWRDARLWSEWSAVTSPLAQAAPPDDEIELLGGDEVDGRVTCVVERRRRAAPRLRWWIDDETFELRRAAILDDGGEEACAWSIADPRDFGERRWPARMVRRDRAGRTATIELLRLDAGPGPGTARGPENARAAPERAQTTPAGNGSAPAPAPPGRSAFADAIAAARERVVKLYGAGVGRVKGYGSGVLVSPDGKIVTALSSLLETGVPRVVLADGRRFTATVVARDARLQLALLDIDAADLPHFALSGGSGRLEPGDWVLAASNVFKVADGPEPVSFSLGVFAGRAALDARRRAQEFTYDGPVLLTDVIVSAPGCAGGGLLDADGRLVGVIGKELESRRTHTWLNYAVPVEAVAEMVASAAVGGGQETATRAGAGAAGGRGDEVHLAALGLVLFDVGGRVRPAYIERVRAGSPAARAGLRANDLVLSLDDAPVASCDDLRREAGRLRIGQAAEIVVKRGDSVVSLEIVPEAPDER